MSESGCKNGDYCAFRHTEAGGKPTEKSTKSGGKGSVAMLKESIHLGCVSQVYLPRKSIIWDRIAVKFSKGTWHHIKIRRRKGASRGIIQKCNPHERSPCAPKFEEKHRKKPCTKKAWDLAKNVYKLKKQGEGYVLYSHRMGDAGTLFEEARGTKMCGRFWSILKPFKDPKTPHGLLVPKVKRKRTRKHR